MILNNKFEFPMVKNLCIDNVPNTPSFGSFGCPEDTGPNRTLREAPVRPLRVRKGIFKLNITLYSYLFNYGRFKTVLSALNKQYHFLTRFFTFEVKYIRNKKISLSIVVYVVCKICSFISS
jgi:hypothetical protein